MRVAIHTLGCKANQYETQAMETILRQRGPTLVPFDWAADAYIVNSCTVTAVSDKKSRQAVRQARKRAPEAVVALCGCYPQVSPEAAAALDCDLIAGTGDRTGFLDLLEQAVRSREKTVSLDDALRRRTFEFLPAGGLEGRTRAMLKAEDGCANFCAYCIIPYARGPVRSLPLEKAGMGNSVYFLARTVGAFLGGLILMKYPTPRFFAASVFLALASLVGLVFSHSLAAILVFVALFGLGYSNLFAIIFSVSMQRVPEKTNEVSALLIVGVCGGAVIPPVLGVVTDSLGSQVWAVAALALVWVYLVFLIRHIRKLA